MAKPAVNLPIQEVLSNVTLTARITGLVKWKFQLWVATGLIKLATRILNMDIDIKQGDKESWRMK